MAALCEAVEVKDALLAAAEARIGVLTERVAGLERRLGRDSSTSSKPPSSDSPYTKKSRDRSLRGRSGRRPGKQPSAQSATLKQSGDPDERVECGPSACAGCGADLAEAEVVGVQKRQVFEAQPPPPPKVIEYQVVAKACPGCGAARLLATLTGTRVSVGFVAGVRARAAGRLGPFMDRVRVLLREARVLYADETPARTAGHLHYVHVACTEFLTAMHTGGRSAEDIDAGQVLSGYTGVIVRDGYAGYQHLADALHAWCGAHSLRDLRAVYEPDPDGQVWARSMADLLIDANKMATAARAAGKARLSDQQLAEITAWYRGAVAKGIADNQGKRT